MYNHIFCAASPLQDVEKKALYVRVKDCFRSLSFCFENGHKKSPAAKLLNKKLQR